MSSKDITIYDIAKKLNLAPSTVSRALNNHKGTNKNTIALVKKTAGKMGYMPNNIAASLRNNKTKTIGLIIPKVTMHFIAMAISGIQDKANELGYSLIISQTNDDIDLEMQSVNAMLNVKVEGVIASATMFTNDFSVYNKLMNKNVPLVFFDRVPSNPGFFVIEGDDYQGGFLATEHLIKRGCTRIAHFGGPPTANIYYNRFKGYKDALQKYNIPYDEDLYFINKLTDEDARKSMEALLALKKLPNGLFSANDTAAIAAIRMAVKKGLKVPEQLAVVGYSDDPSTELVTPAVTTINQSPYEMGQHACETLIDMLRNRDKVFPNKQIMGVQLIKREST
jgi:LacI family transcriptional regulator